MAQNARHSAAQILRPLFAESVEGETWRWVPWTADSADFRRIRDENCSGHHLLGLIVAASGRAFHSVPVMDWVDVRSAVSC